MSQEDSPQANSATQPSRLRVADLSVDLERRSVKRGSESLDLTDRSFRLFETLLKSAPEVVSKDQLIDAVWDDAVVSDETLAQRVRLLRQSLGDDSQSPRYIESVRGRGYRFIAKTTRRGKWLPLVAAAAALIAVVLVSLLLNSPGIEKSVDRANALAVLPFADMSADQEHQFFADGMHEELLSRLAMINGLAVISRTSVERYRGATLSLPDIARELGADAVVEGSVRVDGDRLRVTVQLIDAASDEHTWAANFDRQLSMQGIFELQQEVATQIAEALEYEYANAEGHSRLLPTGNIDAYNLYLLGRYHVFRQTRQDLESAIDYLDQAIALDPEFAEAYAALGWAYSFLGTGYGTLMPMDVYPKAKEAALRAIALDEKLADARTLYADILTWYDWDFAAAEREYLRTMELDPLNVLGYALFLSTQERHTEAIAMIERRIAAHPNDPYVWVNAGWRYLHAGQTDKAIDASRRAGEHRDRAAIHGWSLLAQGKAEDAVAVFEASLAAAGQTSRTVGNLAVALFRAGRREDARLLLTELEEFAAENYVAPGTLAAVYFAAGDADRGFELLDAAFEQRSRDMIFLKVNEPLRDYRDDPRYLDLIERVGL